MSERLTAERAMSGAVIRAAARLLDASYLDEAPTEGQRELWRESACQARDEIDKARAEIDRLRALPVIAACGHCGWARDATRSFVLCSKVTHNSLGWRVAVPHDHEPPAWCPMRGER